MRTFRSTAFALAAGALTAALAGCDEGPTTTVTFRLDDARQIAHAVMAEGPLLVAIAGTPYRGEPSDLAEGVVAEMRRAFTWYASPRFTTDAAEAASPTLRVAVTFNGGSALSGRDQCRGRATGGEPLDGGRVEVVATFCDGAEVLANVRGRIGGSETASDPRFTALIRQVTRDMFAEAARP